MPRVGRGSGFTLMEVGLAITVGTVLVAAAAFAYHQAKESAGDSVARQRVADLQTSVESFYTSNNRFPDAAEVGRVWATRTDATRSAWGGDVVSEAKDRAGNTLAEPRCGTNGCGVTGGDLPDSAWPGSGVRGGPKDQTSSYIDSLYYYRLTIPGQPATCCLRLWDAGRRLCKSVYGYAVAHDKHMQRYFFVETGRPAQADLQPGVAPCPS